MAEVLADLPGQGRGFLQAGTLRQVDHHLKLAFIVKGEHLDRGQFEWDQGKGGRSRRRTRIKNRMRFFLFFQKGAQVPFINTVEKGQDPSLLLFSLAPPVLVPFKTIRLSQGLTMKAINREMIMAAEAPTGMGLI